MTPRHAIRLDPKNDEGALEQTLEALDAGSLVCVPTETVYGIGGRVDRPAALQALREFKGGRGDSPFTIHAGSQESAFQLADDNAQARRLARSYWPGPLTLVLPANAAGQAFANPSDGTVGVRVVAHPFTSELCARAEAPIVLSSANRSGQPPPATFEDAIAAVDDAVDVAVDAGPCKVAAPSSVVRIGADGSVDILREGALETDKILARAATLILFVCSGNTCRSPMAETLARSLWAGELGVSTSDLARRGILVASAGVGAFPGMPASENAVRSVAELGLDLTHHRSRLLEPALLARAHRTFCMGESHRRVAESMLEMAGGPFDADAWAPELLAGGDDIVDPFGGSIDVYRATRDQIASCLGPVDQVLATRE